MVDAFDSKSNIARCGGSSPLSGTDFKKRSPWTSLFKICAGEVHDLGHVREDSNRKPVYEIFSKKWITSIF